MESIKKFLKNAKRWVTLDHHPILYPLVSRVIIPLELFNNHGKFKPGDKVKYNLFAKIVIGRIEEIKGGTVYTIDDYEPWSTSKSNVRFTYDENSGCDVFWIRKLYPWERWAFFKNFRPRTNHEKHT